MLAACCIEVYCDRGNSKVLELPTAHTLAGTGLEEELNRDGKAEGVSCCSRRDRRDSLRRPNRSIDVGYDRDM